MIMNQDLLCRSAGLNNRSLSTINLSQSSELSQLGAHTEAAEDLLAIAVTVYCADRSIVRKDQADGWTRYITIEVPVRDPDRGDKDFLQETVSFLTGDHWRIELRRGQPNPGLRTTDRALIPPIRWPFSPAASTRWQGYVKHSSPASRWR